MDLAERARCLAPLGLHGDVSQREIKLAYRKLVIRHHPDKGGDTPAVALTAYAEPRDREEAFASGFQEYLNKPVDAGMLSTTILKLAEIRKPSTAT